MKGEAVLGQSRHGSAAGLPCQRALTESLPSVQWESPRRRCHSQGPGPARPVNSACSGAALSANDSEFIAPPQRVKLAHDPVTASAAWRLCDVGQPRTARASVTAWRLCDASESAARRVRNTAMRSLPQSLTVHGRASMSRP